MTPAELNRAWNDVAAHIDDASYTMVGVALTAGFVAGGNMPYSVALVVGLAEKVYGVGDADLIQIKRKLGLAGRIEETSG